MWYEWVFSGIGSGVLTTIIGFAIGSIVGYKVGIKKSVKQVQRAQNDSEQGQYYDAMENTDNNSINKTIKLKQKQIAGNNSIQVQKGSDIVGKQ